MSYKRIQRTIHSVGLALLSTVLLAGCSGYGGETVGAPGDERARVETNGEHCAVILPEGWTWLPASWSARSPNGTTMTFTEELIGRPQYADWDEIKGTAVEEVRRRSPNAEIEEREDGLRIDYGANGGLTVMQRFDRVSCKISFSNTSGSRAEEIGQWNAIIDSLERSSPTENYTPVTE